MLETTGKRITATDYDKRVRSHPLDYLMKEFFEPVEKQKAKRIEAIIEALSPRKSEKILDIGCGLGPFIFQVSKRGAKCFGIDYSKKFLKEGKKILKKICPRTENNVLQANALCLPFKEKSFDKILNADFLEHIYNDEKKIVVQEMARILKPNGIVVSYTPNKKRVRMEYFIKKILLALRGKRLGWQKSDEKTILFDTELHVGLSDASELKRLFEENGFRVKKTFFLEYSFPLLGRVFPGLKIMANLFGAQILVVAQKK